MENIETTHVKLKQYNFLNNDFFFYYNIIIRISWTERRTNFDAS